MSYATRAARAVSIGDLRRLAARRLPRVVFDYIDGGADGEVTEAVLSGAAEGDITDAFDPNPFAFDDELIVGSSEVSGDTVGTVTLDITIVFDFKGPFTFEDSAEVELDGSCEAPPTSESTTTSTTVAAQADVRPTFTG